jgi:hypothetical protein
MRWARAARVAVLVVAGGLLAAGSSALWAQKDKSAPQVFIALATGSQEVPSADTPAVGLGRFSLAADGTLSYEVTVANLKAKPTLMHLHRGKAGVAGDVVYTLTTPTAQSGLTTGTVTFKQEDLADLMSQGLYLNIHTEAFPAGEVRGQVVSSPAGVEVISSDP